MLTFGLFPNTSKQNVKEVIGKIISYLTERKVRVLIPENIANKMVFPGFSCPKDIIMTEAALGITMGGDGTMLQAAREVALYGMPVCGINMGQLGFLAEIEVNEQWPLLDRLIKGDYFIEERLMLDVTVIRQKEAFYISPALNDAVVTKGGFSRMVGLKLFIDGELTMDYPADGIIVATSTGSTGYSLSAGGPIINPNLRVLVITPICPHTLQARSLVFSEKEEIQIKMQAAHNDIVLTVDGQIVFPLMPDDTVKIERSPFRARFIRFAEKSYYQALRTKLRRGDRNNLA